VLLSEGISSMATGTIKTIQGDRGFGFVTPDGAPERGSDVFFHRTVVENDGFDMLRVGQRVEFESGPDDRNPGRTRATSIIPLDE
jgi:CspA family cold shock protein